MRLERVAYKKIANHLDKTELACRLHYHQLSHGGNRRKRNTSVSSNSSNTAASNTAGSNGASTAAASPATSKNFVAATSGFSPVNANGAIQKSGAAATPLRTKGKPLLPKPADTSIASSSPRRLQSAGKGKGLRVNCNPDSIDKERLKRIIKENEGRFWETVAAQYGDSIDPELLRTFWHKGAISPPTPSSQVTSPAAQSEDGNQTVSTVSEVSTPISSLSPNGSEICSIKEENMEDAIECESPTKTA